MNLPQGNERGCTAFRYLLVAIVTWQWKRWRLRSEDGLQENRGPGGERGRWVRKGECWGTDGEGEGSRWAGQLLASAFSVLLWTQAEPAVLCASNQIPPKSGKGYDNMWAEGAFSLAFFLPACPLSLMIIFYNPSHHYLLISPLPEPLSLSLSPSHSHTHTLTHTCTQRSAHTQEMRTRRPGLEGQQVCGRGMELPHGQCKEEKGARGRGREQQKSPQVWAPAHSQKIWKLGTFSPVTFAAELTTSPQPWKSACWFLLGQHSTPNTYIITFPLSTILRFHATMIGSVGSNKKREKREKFATWNLMEQEKQ